jgi:hypothetical protein
MKVNFIIAGAMKSGTTTLSEILRRHPDVEFFVRETQFFTSYKDWRSNLDKYEGLFTRADAKLYGEASTHYTYYPEFKLNVWKDIYEYNPGMKFIYVVRNPVDRALSQYMHMYERGYTDYSLEEAIRHEPTIINNGRYYTQIKPFIDQFGRDNVLILDFDDLKKNIRSILRDISVFLDIDEQKFTNVENVHSNVTIGGGKWHYKYDRMKKFLNRFRSFFPRKFRNAVWDIMTGRNRRAFAEKPEVSPEIRQVILNLTRLDILELQKLTGRDYSGWFVV